jgi:hypothetical protein
MSPEFTLPSGWSRKQPARQTLQDDETTSIVFENDAGDRRIEVVPTRIETASEGGEWRVRDVHAQTTTVLESAPDRSTAVEKAIDAMGDAA